MNCVIYVEFLTIDTFKLTVHANHSTNRDF